MWWFTFFLTVFTGLLVLVGIIQSVIFLWTYQTAHRPKIAVGQMTLLNDLEVDNALRAPIEVGMYLANRGNGRAKILQGNVTLLFGPSEYAPEIQRTVDDAAV